jgi:hypothetical protein
MTVEISSVKHRHPLLYWFRGETPLPSPLPSPRTEQRGKFVKIDFAPSSSPSRSPGIRNSDQIANMSHNFYCYKNATNLQYKNIPPAYTPI